MSVLFRDIETLLKMYWEAEKNMHKEPSRFRHLAAEVANMLHEVKVGLAIMTHANKNLKMELESVQEELYAYSLPQPLKKPA